MATSAPVRPKVKVEPKAKKDGRGRPVGSRNKMFGLPVREAKETLVIPLLQIDIDTALKQKPEDVNAKENFLGCVIAQGATRVCGTNRVAILRRHAYVAFPGDKHTKRYTIDDKSRQVLEAWDRGEPVLEGVELRLLRPSKSLTLAAHRKAARKYEAAHPGAARARNEGARKTDRKQKRSDPLHDVVRNGNLVKWAS